MHTITQLARRFHLSRSTLLYYDRIGLLRAARRTRSNYRLYSELDMRRLEQICFYRKTGMPLSEIQSLLNAEGDDVTGILEKRLRELEREIQAMKAQQQVILKLLRQDRSHEETESRMQGMDRKRWTALLRSVGLNDEDMRNWHREFERMTPEGHGEFLASLGIPSDDIQMIRKWSRGEICPGQPSEKRTDTA